MSKPLLKAENLEISFHGVKAADGVNLEINEGEFLAIIGPNGAGKTTLLNLCTGYLKPSAGHVYLDGKQITHLSPRQIAKRGIARAFQIPQLFTDHRVIDNVMLSNAARLNLWQMLSPLDRPRYRDEAMELLRMFNLADHANDLASTLPEGRRKLLDIAVALALKPRLVLLDEPTSGVSAIERFGLMETLMTALRQAKVTALFVEHDMDVVRRYAERVLVWNRGHVLTQGRPEEVFQDQRVIETVVGAV
ncbi:ABC transporter ATP-binding protein [Nitratireductor aestuarii]|uniref:ABC transporter ATP-binding protein n=1 Tax=Nitratireductor aestuarii TaxID=1735103 RepID=A0A916W1B3_9HYPH|nr:ABC transporter ATP-binding protein [Nitratireductor aestuarii]GGA59227.1 ABC transporter ATP-binding protein [Nitratireductor aestuarii]